MPLHRLPPGLYGFPRPSGYHSEVRGYLASSASDRRDRVWDIYPEEPIRRELPGVLAGGLSETFRKHMVAVARPADVYELFGTRFWGYYGGSLIGRDNRLLGDLSHDVWTLERHKALGCICLPPLRKLAGTTAVIATAEAASNYWHWMMEVIPRLHLLEKAGFTPDKVDHYLSNASMTAFQKETLLALGIPLKKVVFVNARTHLELERAVVPTIWPASWDIPRWLPPVVAGLPLAQVESPIPSGKLFLSRAGEAGRQLQCEAELAPELERLGFSIVRCREFSVAQQRALFAKARIVVAPHGAALTNLVFCRPGTAVLDLMSSAWPAPYFWGLASALGLHYSVVVDGPSQSRSEERNREITLTAGGVLHCVDEMLRQPLLAA